MEELKFHLKEVPCFINVVSPNCPPLSNYPGYTHQVLFIKSRRASNKAWVIDLCGAQYGLYESLSEWVQYADDFVESVSSSSPLGTTKQSIDQKGQNRGKDALSYGLVGRAAQALDAATTTWEEHNGTLSRMRSLPDAAYQQQKTDLLQAVSNAVRTFVATNDFTALVRR